MAFKDRKERSSMRTFVPITIDELKNKIEKSLERNDELDYTTITRKVEEDLEKVSFDTENLTDPPHYKFGPKNLIGYHTASNDLSFLGLAASGDWQFPVFFLIYWSGKELRGYIPTRGNFWNTDGKCAYGEDEKEDIDNIKKRFGLDVESIDDLDYSEANEKEIIEDIIEHFENKTSQDFLGSKNRYQPTIENIHKGLGIQPLSKRIEALEWYGSTENEGYELFDMTCSLCYYMTGIGDHTEKAEKLYEWARELAEESKKWCEKEDLEGLEEVTNGQWG
jgi:hypothetical protein